MGPTDEPCSLSLTEEMPSRTDPSIETRGRARPAGWLFRWLTVLLPVVSMLAIGLWGVDRGSMWQDEEATYEVSRRSVAEIWSMVHNIDIVHAFYYLLIHAWSWFGDGEVWIRIPSVVASAASAGLIALTGRRLVSSRAGLLAGLLFSALPFVSFYAQEARSFALVAALVLLATYCLLRSVQTPRTGWWLGYAAASATAVLMHEFAVLAVAAHAVMLLFGRMPWRTWWRWGLCALLCGLLVAPLALISQRQAGQLSWLKAPTFSTVIELARSLAGPAPLSMVLLILLSLVGLAVGPRSASATASAPTVSPAAFRVAVIAVPLLVVPPAVLLVASLIHPLFVDRYVLYSAAAIPLLAGAGLDRLTRLIRRPGLGWTASLALVLVVFSAQWGQLNEVRTVASRSDDLAGAARVVAAGAQPGDGVLFMPSKYRSAALAYPNAFAGLHDLSLALSPTKADNLRGVDKSRVQTRKAMLAADRVWVISRSNRKVSANEKGAISERDTLRSDFRQVRRTEVHGLEIGLYIRH